MKKIKLFATFILNFILLSASYFLGIGLTALFSKTFAKKFLNNNLTPGKKSNFTILNSRSSLEKMF